MSRPAPEPLPRPEPATKYAKCAGCGFFVGACHCSADMEFLAGDIVVRVDAPDGPRYVVDRAMPGWFAAHRIRKDGKLDRREYGFSASPKWYIKAAE